jgi:membrane protease YdiL (CAAX protease family)
MPPNPAAAAPEPSQPTDPRRKRRALIEAAVSYFLILAVIWTPRPAQRWLWWVAASAVVFCTCISFDGAAAMGFGARNLLRSLWVVCAALAVAAVAVAVAARLHTLHRPPGFISFVFAYLAYAIWAFAQQFLLQSFFLLRFMRALSSARWAALAAAIVFAAAHIPNPILVPITFIWGLAACFLFLRYRSIYPLAAAHAILGVMIAITVPGPVDHNMRVGWSYLAYSHRGRHLHPR